MMLIMVMVKKITDDNSHDDGDSDDADDGLMS